MTAITEDAARAALRARQGKGARYDAPNAPGDDLLLARRGTAYFARKLNELSDPELDAPSLVPGWSRRRVIAYVSYQARGLAELTECVRTGVEPLALPTPASLAPEVGRGTTLPVHALRNLFRHSEVHLNVEWRDLTDDGWEGIVPAPGGRTVKMRQIPLLRARTVWLAAFNLNNGARVGDFPAPLAGLGEITGTTVDPGFS